MKAIAFNYLDDSLESREITTEFKTVDEFWYGTSVGPLMKAEVWKDTGNNREIIKAIIREKRALKKYKDDMAKIVYGMVNTRDK